MRTILSISLPEGLKRDVDEAMKTEDYASKSDFFCDLIRSWKEVRLLNEIRESQKEIKDGKGKVLHSLADLD